MKGVDEVFSNIQWSPAGDKAAFIRRSLRSDLKVRERIATEKEYQLVVMNPDGSNLMEVSQTDALPFIWSDDGSKITFIYDDHVWEYRI
jgi:Tol biopolymer transport system component